MTRTITTKPEILFLCVHNAGRSQMAAGFARHMAGERIVVHSAGTAPSDVLNPAVVEVMGEKGIDIIDHRPQVLTQAMGLNADVIITMGCGDVCPVYPGRRYLDWELSDPVGKSVDEIRAIRDEIEQRVATLVEELLASTS